MAEEKISKLKDRELSEMKHRKIRLKKPPSISDLWDDFQQSNRHVIETP